MTKHSISLLTLIILLLVACKQQDVSNVVAVKKTSKNKLTIAIDSLAQIEELKILSSDDFMGRATGTKGAIMARDYIKNKFTALQLDKLGESYVQAFDYKGRSHHDGPNSGKAYNVLGFIKGTEKSNKFIVVGAHYDHLGKTAKKVYNGADDNASGTAALFSVIRYFKKNPPKHSIIVAAWDAEEVGLLGSKYYINNSIILQKDILLNINMDMIGRNDDNELYISGSRHDSTLSEKVVPALYSDKIALLTGHDGADGKQNWTYSSDHGSFYQKGIPFLYFGVEDHSDYHRATDEFHKIQPGFYMEATRVVIQAIVQADKAFYK